MLSFVLVAAGAFAATAVPPDTPAPCAKTLSNWKVLTRMIQPKFGPSKHPVNVVSIDEDAKLFWNGEPVSESQARQYLNIVRQMGPANVTILAADRRADCAFVARIREVMNDDLSCTPRSCGQVVAEKVEPVLPLVLPIH